MLDVGNVVLYCSFNNNLMWETFSPDVDDLSGCVCEVHVIMGELKEGSVGANFKLCNA